MKGKRGQQMFGMSFGMMFSIFLIVIFIVIVFIAVAAFLDWGKTSSVGLFYEDLQNAVDDAWRSQSTDADFEVDLPSKIKKICFADLNAEITGDQEDYLVIKDFEFYEANTFLIPPGETEGLGWKLIEHLDIDRITENENPYCVPASNNLRIKKDFYDKLVMIR